jgi:hypothetical protein
MDEPFIAGVKHSFVHQEKFHLNTPAQSGCRQFPHGAGILVLRSSKEKHG